MAEKKAQTKKPRGEAHTLETIQAKCAEVGDCWIWEAATCNGTPYLSHQGRMTPVRRYIIEVIRGEKLYGDCAAAKCREKLCVAPDHAVGMTNSEVQKMHIEANNYNRDPMRRARLGGEKNGAARLTNERRDAAIADSRPATEVAAGAGVSASQVRRLKAKDREEVPAGSVWYGLSTRNKT